MLVKVGWSPILITALAVAGYIYEWPIEVLVPVLVIILIINLFLSIKKVIFGLLQGML